MARFERVKPLENFWIVDTPEGHCIGSGAWEVALRWSWVDYSGGRSVIAPPGPPPANAPFLDLSGVQTDITFGLNWYWNPYSRMSLNYIHAFNSYSANVVLPDAAGLTPDMGTIAVRWQVDF
jgi:phosphate-selective porin OprO/OprP